TKYANQPDFDALFRVTSEPVYEARPPTTAPVRHVTIINKVSLMCMMEATLSARSPDDVMSITTAALSHNAPMPQNPAQKLASDRRNKPPIAAAIATLHQGRNNSSI